MNHNNRERMQGREFSKYKYQEGRQRQLAIQIARQQPTYSAIIKATYENSIAICGKSKIISQQNYLKNV